jgi:hypothetical protein
LHKMATCLGVSFFVGMFLYSFLSTNSTRNILGCRLPFFYVFSQTFFCISTNTYAGNLWSLQSQEPLDRTIV